MGLFDEKVEARSEFSKLFRHELVKDFLSTFIGHVSVYQIDSRE